MQDLQSNDPAGTPRRNTALKMLENRNAFAPVPIGVGMRAARFAASRRTAVGSSCR
jgi:hypothetical protein